MPGLPLWVYAAIGGAAIVAGAGWYVFEIGRDAEKGAAATVIVKETGDARKSREGIERGERDRTDDAATRCLRNPAGC